MDPLLVAGPLASLALDQLGSQFSSGGESGAASLSNLLFGDTFSAVIACKGNGMF